MPCRAAAALAGDAEDEPPTTAGSCRKPRPSHARRTLPLRCSGMGFGRREGGSSVGGGDNSGGTRVPLSRPLGTTRGRDWFPAWEAAVIFLSMSIVTVL
jgi:hypothetical protein